MDSQTIALALVLDALGIAPSVDGFGQRKSMQKGIYLAQRLGAELGHDFSWYVYGPYSTSLARQYFKLAEVLKSQGRGDLDTYELSQPVRTRLENAMTTIKGGKPVGLSLESWLELIASYDYLVKKSGLDDGAARQRLSTTKGHLLPYLDAAKETLDQVEFHDAVD